MCDAYAVDSPFGRHLLPGWSVRVVFCTVNSIVAALSLPPPQPAAVGVNRRGNALTRFVWGLQSLSAAPCWRRCQSRERNRVVWAFHHPHLGRFGGRLVLSGSDWSVSRLCGRYARSCQCIGPRYLTCCLHYSTLSTRTSLLAAANVCELCWCPPPIVLVRARRVEFRRSTRVDWTAVRYCVAQRTAVAVVVVDRVVSLCRSLSCRCGLDPLRVAVSLLPVRW